jgi:hypothetical protein
MRGNWQRHYDPKTAQGFESGDLEFSHRRLVEPIAPKN